MKWSQKIGQAAKVALEPLKARALMTRSLRIAVT
jgi:hypothetical protein